MAGTTQLVSRALTVPVALRFDFPGIGSERLDASGSWLQTWPGNPRQLFRSSELATSKSQPSSSRLGVVVRVLGEPFGALRASPSTPSAPSLQAVPTQTRNAPVTSFADKVASSLVVPGELRNEPSLNILETTNAETAEEMEQWIEDIRGMFRSMTDGEISKSAYDTAWVALVPALDGSHGPQFPQTLRWIIDHQFADGSWGDFGYFSYFDRLCNTLACVVALQTWHTGAAAVERGVKFVQQNLQMIETEEQAHMMIGFEIVFPALISEAQKLGLDLPYDSPIIETISSERQKKLKQIPMEIVHKVPTTVLHSLEGFHQEVDWEKLLKLQSEDGSFLNSPAATAACLLHTKDEKALGYLNGLLQRFSNAVPNVYPVDLFEHMWIVDRIQRLGIDRYFQNEIKDSLDYVYKYFTSFGIGWARGGCVHDLDDTAMGFRLLRQHGYDVKENVFQQFRGKSDDFFCFAGQSGQAVTGLFNFYRATQIRFAGEALLEAAEPFARNFLSEKLAKNECFDKWTISKDLAGEVKYAIDTPWHCSLPRLETRAYLDHYGPQDIWIGKSLYRMLFVNNETFLALAKADFNLCQSIHQQDLQQIVRWNEGCEFRKLTYARQKFYEGFFTAASVFPDPHLAPARLVWTRNCVLTTVVDDFFDVGGVLPDMHKFVAAAREWDPSLMDGTAHEAKITFNGLYNTINAMAQDGISAQGRDIGRHLKAIWLRFLESVLTEAEWTASGYWPSFDEYLETALPSIALEPIVLCSLFFLGEPISDELVKDPKKLHLMALVNRVGRLVNDIQGHERETSQGKASAIPILLRENSGWTEDDAVAYIRDIVQESMLELVREVHQPSHIPKSIRLAHFNMARVMQLFYRKTDGFSSLTAMKALVKRILFDPV